MLREGKKREMGGEKNIKLFWRQERGKRNKRKREN